MYVSHNLTEWASEDDLTNELGKVIYSAAVLITQTKSGNNFNNEAGFVNS